MEPSALEMEEAAMFTDMGIELVGCATLVDALHRLWAVGDDG